MKLSDTTKVVLVYAAGIVISCVIGYYAWQIGREINYNWSYKDMVQETICNTVKHEHLQNPTVCGK